jgi:hypothetical protein
MINNYAPFTPIPHDPESFLTGIRRADSDFMLRQAQLQGLEGMMTGNKQAAAEHELYRAKMPNEINISNLAGAKAQTLNTPSFLQDYLGGQRGEQQSLGAKGQFDQATNPGRIGATNMGNTNAELREVAQFLNMVSSSAGPDVANKLYQQVIGPDAAKRGLPPSYDPKTFDSFLNAAAESGMEFRRNRAVENVRGGHAMERTREEGRSRREIEEMQQRGANYRAGLAADADRDVADKRGSLVQETPAKARARLRRALSQNPDQPEMVDEYKTYLEDDWTTQTQRDPGLTLLRIQALTATDPAAKEQANSKYNELRQQFFAEKGFHLNAPPAGTVRRHPERGMIRFKGGFGRDPRNLDNWESVNND